MSCLYFRLFVSKSASSVRKSAVKIDADEEEGAGDKAVVSSEPLEKVGGGDEEDEEESDADVADDADATSANRRAKHADEHEYEEEGEGADGEDKKMTATPEDEGFEDEDQAAKEEEDQAEQVEKPAKRKSEEDEEEESAELEESMTEEMEQAIEKRKVRMMSLDPWIIDYEFDTKKSLWARLTLSVSSIFMSLN